jgi:hypothetical protein
MSAGNSEWLYQAALIVPAEQRAQGDTLAEQVTGRSGQESDTYSIPLSDLGSGPATHYACCTCVTAAMLSQMQAILGANGLPGVRFYRWDARTFALLSTNSPEAASSIGQPWGWAESVADAGLSVISSGEGGAP